MFAGNIGTAQALEVIVEAAALLKEYTDINFVILGDGSRYDWMLKKLIAGDYLIYTCLGGFL